MKLICKAQDCTVELFMTCVFDKKLGGLIVEGSPDPEDLVTAIQSIIDEFYDLSGLDQDLEELETVRRFKYLEARNKVVAACVYAQRSAVMELNKPFVEDFDLFVDNGYTIHWNGDKEEFLRDINIIEASEGSYRDEFNGLKAEIESEPMIKPMATRRNFISTINQLEKLGNKIDIKTTSVERLAIMISDEKELYNQRSN